MTEMEWTRNSNGDIFFNPDCTYDIEVFPRIEKPYFREKQVWIGQLKINGQTLKWIRDDGHMHLIHTVREWRSPTQEGALASVRGYVERHKRERIKGRIRLEQEFAEDQARARWREQHTVRETA